MRYFGIKSIKVPRGQMGTKPAKVAHSFSWPTKAAKPGLFPVIEDIPVIEDKKVSEKGLRSAGGPKLLKWDLRPWARAQICKSPADPVCLLPPGG